MYSFKSKIRYSETDSRGRLSLEALLDYFQDCSAFQSEALGVGFYPLQERGLAWVLSYWQIVVDRFPDFYEDVETGTYPYNFKGCFGQRNFFMKDKDGNFLAKADSLWSLIDTKAFKLTNIPEDVSAKYEKREKLPMDYAGRKIAVPEGGCMEENITVNPHHLDTNHHVNNAQYVRMAAAYLPESFEIGQMRVEYRKQALLHDVLHPYVVKRTAESGEELYTVSLQDEEGKAYANVEFKEKKHD